ncbi:MAG: hypothetical protein LBV45_02055, partial [Xanthomonadaceae bacterium]|nr:hypothetical protein [Xanthomonadaceae bacterium]
AWQAPGTDGQSPLFVAGYTQTSVGDDYYNWVFRGFRRFDAALSVLDIPDHGGDKALLLNNLPIAYWFIAQAGHLKVIVRISNVYEWLYAGYGLPYETPAQHPYPYLSGAPWGAGNARWDLATAGGYRNPCDPGSASSGITANAGLAAYFPDSQWRQVCNRYSGNNTSEGYGDSSGRAKTWPYAVDENGSVQPNHLRDAIGGAQPLIPVVIFNPAPAHVWGEFDGVYFVAGYNNTAEALLQVGAIDHLVVPNIHRGTLNNYCAIALD